MSDEPLYCVRYGNEECECSGGRWPDEVPKDQVGHCHFCGVKSRTTCCDECHKEISNHVRPR